MYQITGRLQGMNTAVQNPLNTRVSLYIKQNEGSGRPSAEDEDNGRNFYIPYFTKVAFVLIIVSPTNLPQCTAEVKLRPHRPSTLYPQHRQSRLNGVSTDDHDSQ
ncbi:hypothetical protein CEXT_182471 [Caerostris extrusa]|uniref:Uncharacterized protein n=1 Tax=Caerostris extrusa TaxID=172846 RepID=A0AAV4MWX8_CAEEX|nr:hypothetical protein CEXT_182471 [Caerostris extrusa]